MHRHALARLVPSAVLCTLPLVLAAACGGGNGTSVVTPPIVRPVVGSLRLQPDSLALVPGATGTFVLATRTGARPVEVAGATAFVDPRVATDTFGSVCVGRLVGALGSPGSGSACLAVGCPADPIAARFVVVAGPAPVVVVGAVTAVGGS